MSFAVLRFVEMIRASSSYSSCSSGRVSPAPSSPPLPTKNYPTYRRPSCPDLRPSPPLASFVAALAIPSRALWRLSLECKLPGRSIQLPCGIHPSDQEQSISQSMFSGSKARKQPHGYFQGVTGEGQGPGLSVRRNGFGSLIFILVPVKTLHKRCSLNHRSRRNMSPSP